MTDFVEIARALGDPNRVEALLLLRAGERCVCRIIERLELAPSTVSKHMSILRQAGLVKSRKEGRWIYYKLAAGSNDPVVQGALKWLQQSAKQLAKTI